MKYFFIRTFVPCSILVPILVGLIRFRHLQKTDRVMLAYIIIGGCINLVNSVTAHYGINNMPVFHVYTMLEFILLSIVFSSINNQSFYRIVAYILAIVFCCLSILNSVYIQSIFVFNTYSRSLEALLVISCCIYSYYCLMMQENLVKGPAVWYVSGIFIYFSTAFIIFVMSNIADKISRQQDWIIWNIHAAMVFVLYMFITKGLLSAKHRR